jgi:hypothetical protein
MAFEREHLLMCESAVMPPKTPTQQAASTDSIAFTPLLT